LNVQGSIPTMQQNNMSSLQHGFLYHNHTWWCGTRGLRKEKRGRENDEDIVAKISQDLLQIQANYTWYVCIWYDEKMNMESTICIMTEYRVNITFGWKEIKVLKPNPAWRVDPGLRVGTRLGLRKNSGSHNPGWPDWPGKTRL